MSNKEKIALFWFRRDLRLNDNHGLHHALNSGISVLPIFIFDPVLLNDLPTVDRRVDYIHQAISALNTELQKYGSAIKTYFGNPDQVFNKLTSEYDINAVYCNEDYEPEAINRDIKIKFLLKDKNISFHSYKDHVIFAKNEILKKDGQPYQVYTPYSKAWRTQLQPKHYEPYSLQLSNLYPIQKNILITLDDLGFSKSNLSFVKPVLDEKIINNYDKNRDYPAIEGTTRLSIALRFGTISIRECVRFALRHNDVWLSELIWRDFFIQILYHFPHVVNKSFKKQYDRVVWRNDKNEFDLWCQGKTGFPLVDAGMRELNQTGFMHNRVRMVVASFLIKDLLIDWRWGEAYFAEKLDDYELASNNGNWQWAAGSGCDAAPYFRIFNPETQHEKFDPKSKYVKRWVPEYQTIEYPSAMVDHKMARLETLKRYKEADL